MPAPKKGVTNLGHSACFYLNVTFAGVDRRGILEENSTSKG